VGETGQTVMTEAHSVACFGQNVGFLPLQKVASGLAVQIVAWTGQAVAFAGHWVWMDEQAVICTGQTVTWALPWGGQIVTAVLTQVVALAGQNV
jgi:hypothetical protein